jgi:diguanylate cyclase (GGDEF)-like protein
MISIRKYLDAKIPVVPSENPVARPVGLAGNRPSPCIAAYRAALNCMGHASVDACPALGATLDKALATIAESLAATPSPETLMTADASVRAEVKNWGRSTARHYQQKAAEVKEILLVMAQTAESVGERDQRCAKQLNEVTSSLNSIASLEDISQIRSSIEKSATDLKGSIDRMTAEGKAVLDRLRRQLVAFEARVAEAEQVASCDALTRLRSRLWMESQIERRIAAAKPFCVALLDLDGFKAVNDAHGHVAGDDVLRQFAAELKSACRSTDLVGRWGGDEFLVILDCPVTLAQAQMERVSKWVCGSYTVNREAHPLVLRIRASIGLAEFAAAETMNQLIDRADSAMYGNKPEARRSEPRKQS